MCVPKESMGVEILIHFLSIEKPEFFKASLICLEETFPKTRSSLPVFT